MARALFPQKPSAREGGFGKFPPREQQAQIVLTSGKYKFLGYKKFAKTMQICYLKE